MSTENTTLIFGIILSFFISFAGFFALNQKRKNNPEKNFLAGSILLPMLMLGCLGAYAITFNDNDFICNFSAFELCFYLLGAGIIFLVNQFFAKKISFITTLAIIAFAVVSLPHEMKIFPNLPLWTNNILYILFWFSFCWAFKYLNGTDGVATIQSLTITVGLFLLSVNGAVPRFIGTTALFWSGVLLAFLIFNWYPSKLKLGLPCCLALGFLLGGLNFRSATEGMASCVLVFNLYAVVEIFLAIFKSLFGRQSLSDITANTFYFQAEVSGLSPDNIANNIIRLQIALIVLGYFEAFAPNQYSVPLLSLVICFWYLNKIAHWQEAGKSFKEINRDVIGEIKSNFTSIKDSLNKENNDK